MSRTKQLSNLVPAVVAAGVALALLAGCGSDGTPSASPSVEPSTTASTALPEPPSPLEGTWQAGPVSPRDAEATLRRFGLEKWRSNLQPHMPFEGPTTLILDIRDGAWNLYGESVDGQRQRIDYDADYVVKGDMVGKIHATGATTFRWSVDGERLALEWLETTEPPFKGIPDEVFQRVLYMTRDFERQD